MGFARRTLAMFPIVASHELILGVPGSGRSQCAEGFAPWFAKELRSQRRAVLVLLENSSYSGRVGMVNRETSNAVLSFGSWW